jgi:hypothetical protein
MTLTLFLWLTLAGNPVVLELEPEACRAAETAYHAGELIQIEDAAGRMHKAVRVQCLAVCTEQEPTS